MSYYLSARLQNKSVKNTPPRTPSEAVFISLKREGKRMRIINLQYANGKAAIYEWQVCNMRMDFYGLTNFFQKFPCMLFLLQRIKNAPHKIDRLHAER